MSFRQFFSYMNQAGAGAEGGAAGGAGGGAPAAGGTPGAGGTPAPWHTVGFDADTQGWIANRGLDKLPGVDKAFPEVVKQFRGLEKVIGAPADRVLKLPAETDAPESWNSVYDRLGRPTDAKAYEIPVPEGQSKEFAESMRPVFHELGLSAKQVKGLSEKWNAAVVAHQEKINTEYTQKGEVEAKALAKEWGVAHDKNVGVAKGVAKQFGLSGEAIDALEGVLGYAGVMKFMHKIGAAMGEDKFHSGGNAGGQNFNGVMTPAQAQQRIAALRADADFVKKYLAGGVKEREEMDRLHGMAYPDS